MRAKKASIRQVLPDTVHGSTKVTALIHRVMRDGKKTVAQKQVYHALDIVADKTKKKPLEVVDQVLYAIAPQMEVRSRRVGGAAYQVPMPVKPRRASSLAIHWFIHKAQ
jgi:small subunit ribosomal protein S7